MNNTYEELILETVIEYISTNDFVTREDVEKRLKNVLGDDEKLYEELHPYIKGLLDITFKIFD